MQSYYYSCRTNPKAPILVLGTYWEAQEMRGHPDYIRVDEDGLPMIDDIVAAEKQIPFDKPSRA